MDQLIPRYGPDVRFPSTPFEKGIQSFQEFCGGVPPRTFEAIFALMHIAYACARIHPKRDERHFWHKFFLDILLWHIWIAEQEDKELFVKCAFMLWCDPDFSMTEATELSDDFMSQLHLNLPEIDPGLLNTCSHYSSYPQQPTLQAFDPSMAPSITSPFDLGILELIQLHDKLMEGQVISLCTHYLRDFDDANICAVETTQPQWMSSSLLESPMAMESGQSANSTSSPTRTLTSSTFLGSPGSSSNDSNTTLANSTSSNSPIELLSPNIMTTSYCPECSKRFDTKTDQDNRSSRKRHIRAAHTPYMVRCPEPGCGKEYKSSDNMLRHQRKAHGDASSESLAKGKKSTDTRD